DQGLTASGWSQRVGAATSGAELFLGGCGELVRGDLQLHAVDVTVAEHLHQAVLADQASFHQLVDTDLAALGERLGDVAHVDRLALGAEPVLEATQLRQPHVDGHLPTLETGRHVLAGLGALRAAARGLTLRPVTTADADLVLLSAGCRPQVVDLDGHVYLTSSTTPRCRTVRTRPRTSGLSSRTTVCRFLRSPRGRNAPPGLSLVPRLLQRRALYGCAMSAPPPSTHAQHPSRGNVLERQTAASGHLLRALQALQGRDRGVHDVDRVVAAERLGQHVVDAGALQHSTHRATRDDTGTGAGRTQQHNACGHLTLHRVRDGPGDTRHPEEVLLRLFHALGDRRGNFLGLAVADADLTVTVADDDQRGEAEPPATLDDLGDAVDRDDALEVRVLLLGRPATATVTAVPPVPAATALAIAGARPAALPCTSRHQAFLPLSLTCIRTPTPPREPRRRGQRSGRGSRDHRGRTPPR